MKTIEELKEMRAGYDKHLVSNSRKISNLYNELGKLKEYHRIVSERRHKIDLEITEAEGRIKVYNDRGKLVEPKNSMKPLKEYTLEEIMLLAQKLNIKLEVNCEKTKEVEQEVKEDSINNATIATTNEC